MEEGAGANGLKTRSRRRVSVEPTEENKSPAVNTPTMKRGARRAAKPELELIDENSLVTRPRRRMSVEQPEDKNSPAVNTPNKKRGGRKAAKPDLELIDENTPETTTTRKTNKNTLPKDDSEEKTVTPSRRGTRIRSNTSILSESAVAIDSPRAMRAARRASQAGSDNEAPITPIRQTRRTKRDSSSSVEKEPQLSVKQGTQITEVIIEETEVNTTKSASHSETTIDQNSSPNNIRKSPRLLEKTNKTTPTKSQIDEASNDIPEPKSTTPNKTNVDSTSLDIVVSQDTTDDTKHEIDTADEPNNEIQTSQKNRLSISSANLIRELNTEITTKNINLNKSMSNVQNEQISTKRKRTKSWTTIPISNDNQFHSDNESTKSKLKPNATLQELLHKIESENGLPNTSLNQDKLNKSISKRKKKDSMNIVKNGNDSLDNFNNVEINIEKETENKRVSLDKNNTIQGDIITSELLAKELTGDIKTSIFIDDSDSNSGKANLERRYENEDQCVPVAERPVEVFSVEINSFTSILVNNEQNNCLNKSKRKDSCEPMDVDETISESLILESKELKSPGRKSISTCAHISNLSSEEIINKSERKSSITESLDKSGIETKSTLILSQIKDSISGDNNNVANSPQVTSKLLSKSVEDFNITQENDIKKNLSLHYSTSTPLQDKNVQKFKDLHVKPTIVQHDDSINTTKQPANLSGQYDSSNNENPESSDDDNLKDKNKKIKLQKKISSNKVTTDIGIETTCSENVKKLTEKMKIDDETTNEKCNNINEADADTLLRQNENKSDEISIITKDKGPKKNVLLTSSSDDSEEEEESDYESQENSDFINDQAIEAGADYQSGDSQDESEREYEKENEIIDQGETLTTDDDISEDSDYEKDSFIVSSNEEDEELLDGTDDDLSMSDNELKMTDKSKKKYNDRKIKEQKKASREMFESRHKLNTSRKSSHFEIDTSKKYKRLKISSSESEEEIAIKPRKNNRLRLDSTKEASLLGDESEHKISKKKNKGLSDSSSDISGSNEKEITIFNESVKESDPLSVQFKIEPKTPQKSHNASVAFIDSEDANIDINESTKIQTELFDPLQATMALEEDDDSLSSDNENIMQNYDSILKDLNKSSKLKAKLCDISLNLDKKSKKKEKSAIVDELNLTRAKPEKKFKTKQQEVDSKVEDISKTDQVDESSSDLIDLHLLFSEDSSNSDDVTNKKKGDSVNLGFIPLKRTEEKTNIREVKDESIDTSLNQSISKKNKKRKSQLKENISTGNEEDVNFFIDTVGSHKDNLNISLKKKDAQPIDNIDKSGDSDSGGDLPQKLDNITKTVSISQNDIELIEDEIDETENSDVEAPLEVSFQKDKNTKRESKAQELVVVTDKTDDVADKSINKSINKTPATEKKKNKKTMEEEFSEQLQTDYIADKSIDKSISKTPRSEKKKNKKTTEEEFSEHIDYVADKSINKSISKTSGSDKKKNKKTVEVEFAEQKVQIAEDDYETSSKKRKRKTSVNAKEEETPAEADTATLNKSLIGSNKKKRKISPQDEILTVTETTQKVHDKHQHNKKEIDTNVQSSTGVDITNKKRNKKRKQREDDDANHISKVLKDNFFDKVPRLPSSLLMKLDDKPYKEVSHKKPKAVSTTDFLVQETTKRKNKPSNYLEESVYFNEEDFKIGKQKKQIDKPKMLPFVPTASTSSSGYTTNFNVNILSSDKKFVAQSNTISNFRDNYLNSKKIKRLGTYELYKRQRIVKMSKF